MPATRRAGPAPYLQQRKQVLSMSSDGPRRKDGVRQRRRQEPAALQSDQTCQVVIILILTRFTILQRNHHFFDIIIFKDKLHLILFIACLEELAHCSQLFY